MHRPLLLILLGCVATLGAVASSDWPRWRGPRNDGHLPPGAPALSRLPEEPKVIWSVPAGEGLASPVVAAGVVLAFDNQAGKETLRALDAATGNPKWSAAIDDPFSDTQGPTGPRNTPVIDGDRVYAVSCRGELQCRKFNDGSLLWRANFVRDFEAVFIGERGSAPGASRHGNNASPLVDGPHLLVCVGGTNGAGVVCFDKIKGDVVWKSTSDQAGYAPPVVATLQGRAQVICYTATGVVGLDRATGEVLWRVPVKTSFARHVTTPIVEKDLVIVSSHEAGLLGIGVARTGDAWSAETRWKSKEAAINYASPVAVGGHLYGVGPAKDLVCVDLQSGAVRWSRKDAFSTSAGKSYAGFIAMGERILMLTDGGEVRLFGASPEAYREAGRAQVCGANWCNPAYADGILYLRDGLAASGGNWKAVALR